MKATKLFILGLIAFGCAEGNNVRYRSPNQKGNESFQNSLALGAGSFRNPSSTSGNNLYLADSDIVDVKIDPASGAWTSATFDTRKSTSFAQGSDPIAAARELIQKYADELGFNADEIVLTDEAASEPLPNSVLVVFHRAYNGLPLKGAFIQIYFAKQADGSLRLSEFVNNSYGAVSIKPNVDTSPGDDEVLVAAGLDNVGVENRELMIQPVIGPDGRYEFAYATQYKIRDPESGEIYSLTVTNADLQIVEAYSNHVYERQQITAETFVRSYVLKDQAVRPLQFATIFDGTGQKVITDENGFADFSGSNVSVQLASDLSAGGINNQSQNPKEFFSFKLNLSADKVTPVFLGSTDIASINTFVAMQQVSNYVGRFLTPDQFQLLTNGIAAKVNLPDVCNAFYNGEFLNFFNQGNGCANTGLVSDIVYHEWGHAMDDFLGPRNRSKGQSGITDGAFSEGIGDILSSYMNKSPDLAPGFFLNSTRALRTVKNQRRHPPANAEEAEVHSAGQIIGGAFWDLFTGLSEIYGPDEGQILATQLFLKHLLVTERYTDSYQSVLRVDDLDNNAATPSPHRCLITRSFSAHGLSGSDAVNPDCIDTDTSIKVRVDTDQGDGKLALLVSAAGAARIVGCDGDVKRCGSTSAGFVEFGEIPESNTSVAKSGRKFFEAIGTIQAKDDGAYSIISMDGNGKTLGAKTVTFKPRDRSGDLSQQSSTLR